MKRLMLRNYGVKLIPQRTDRILYEAHLGGIIQQ